MNLQTIPKEEPKKMFTSDPYGGNKIEVSRREARPFYRFLVTEAVNGGYVIEINDNFYHAKDLDDLADVVKVAMVKQKVTG